MVSLLFLKICNKSLLITTYKIKNMNKKEIEFNKGTLLVMSVIFDAIGYLSFTIPVIGEFADVIWAPLSAYLMIKMYKGKLGKVGGVISFVEEILPSLDILPTFTIIWIYKYIIKK